ncbi:MAG: hypothetical protein OXF78_09825 [Rhodospirillales bacterium]|nr:hypothetical protein [Rhodospirillales bacterium]
MDNVLVTMAARHPHQTTQKRTYAEISWALEGAELVTGGGAALRAQLQPITGKLLVAMEGIGEMSSDVPDCSNLTGGSSPLQRKGHSNKAQRQCRLGANGSQLTNRAAESARA